jgi:hypothetical protein
MLDCLKRGGAVRLLRAFARIADYKIRLVLVQAAGHLARRGTRPMKVFTGCGNSCALREHVSRTASRYRARMTEHLARIQKRQWRGPERHVRDDAAIAKDTDAFPRPDSTAGKCCRYPQAPGPQSSAICGAHRHVRDWEQGRVKPDGGRARCSSFSTATRTPWRVSQARQPKAQQATPACDAAALRLKPLPQIRVVHVRARHTVGVWARSDLSSWHPGRRQLVVAANANEISAL